MTAERLAELKKKIANFDIGKLEREIAATEQKIQEANKDLNLLTKNAPLKSQEKVLTLQDKKRDFEGKRAAYNLAKTALDNDIARKNELVAAKITQNQKTIESIILNAPGDLNDLKTGVKEINRTFGFNQMELSGEDRAKAIYVSRDRPDLRNTAELSWRELESATKDVESYV